MKVKELVLGSVVVLSAVTSYTSLGMSRDESDWSNTSLGTTTEFSAKGVDLTETE